MSSSPPQGRSLHPAHGGEELGLLRGAELRCEHERAAEREVKEERAQHVVAEVRHERPPVHEQDFRPRRGLGLHEAVVPSPVTRFFEGGRVSQTLYGVSKTLFDSTYLLFFYHPRTLN